MPDELVNVRYMVDDVEDAVAFYTEHFGFEVRSSFAPAFADVVRGNLRLLRALDAAGTCAVRASVDGRTAKRLGLGRKRVAAGRGRATLGGPGEAAVRVALTRRARAALRAARGDVRVRLTVITRAPGRASAATQVATVLRHGRT